MNYACWQIGDTFFRSHRLFRSRNALWRELKKIDTCWLIDIRLENTFSMLSQTMGRLSSKTTVFWRQGKAEALCDLGVMHSSLQKSSPSLSPALTLAPQMLRAVDWCSVSSLPWLTDCDSGPVSQDPGRINSSVSVEHCEDEECHVPSKQHYWFSLFLVVNIKFPTYQIMAQHCINSQESLAGEMQPVFSLRKIDVYKMPPVSWEKDLITQFKLIILLLCFYLLIGVFSFNCFGLFF